MDPRRDLIAVRHAGHRFGPLALPSFEDVDLTIRRGEFVAVVGPSGGGKTTLLRTMLGLVEPTYGSVVRAPGLRVGFVPRVRAMDAALPLTVFQTVALSCPGVGRTARRDRHRIAELLERLGIGGLAARHLASLSGGERQRVDVARALCGRPDLVVLDEPASAVDVATRRDLVQLFREIVHDGDGPTVLVTTHDVNGVAAHVSRLVAFHRTVVADGPPLEVLHPYVLERTFGVSMRVVRRAGVPIVAESRGVGSGVDGSGADSVVGPCPPQPSATSPARTSPAMTSSRRAAPPGATPSATSPSSRTSTTARPHSSTPCSDRPGPSAPTKNSPIG
ncbi:MAG: ATP-binding cassette domain-containing protein [Ilumatobacteraceae bacterium]